MITIYGIKNCDTMQKALKWLDARGTEYVFHNYKESGIDKATITEWLKQLPLDKVVNLRSTTYKELTAEEKAGVTDKTKAIALMMKHNSLIKRPLWDFGNGKFYLGWNEKELSELI
ncbi:arsenate reductase [Flavipsychrobacter stenotrophus]|uniref:Arsenate reductase n=1 Tax=Flavipsychrobacter stenotrophus TaxID=2077091 RepID=A0A2S7STI2_9BACT|nr:Spx/MgsR family RNA polymerase-binding regulatory protein [Flavipsychrobacter stenotrophus]PQJ10240.1 arsenate reductase [Flavipsychrobacter stenotrophus]